MVAELRRYSTRLDRRVRHLEEADFARHARYLGLRAIYGGMYEPPVAVAAGETLVHLAERRLRQLGEVPDDAA